MARGLVTLPYVQGVMEPVQRILKHHDIYIYSISCQTTQKPQSGRQTQDQLCVQNPM